MLFRRAFTALLFLILTPALARSQSSSSAKKHKPTHAPAKTGTKRRAPAAPPPHSKKNRASSRASTKRHAATSVRAPLPRPEGGREATIGRITASLASSRVGIENPAALQSFFTQLHQLEQSPKDHLVRILQFGDSHTAADMFTGALRTLFQSKFGDGGAGFQYPGYPFAGYRIHGMSRSQSTGWTALGTHFRDLGDGLLGMGGVALLTERAGNWISLDGSAASLEVQYLIQPNGGSIEIYANDRLLTTVSTAQSGSSVDTPSAGHFDASVTPGIHHFEVRTVDNLPVRLLGITTENSSGITYEAAGLNGAEAGLILRWNEPLQQTLVEQRPPALIVLAYGTNEASDHNWTEESYAEMLRLLIARCRRLAPGASILVIGPADRALRAGRRAWTPFSGIDRIVQAQRSVCLQLNCAFWDQRTRMGGFGSMRDWVSVQWAQPDHTHFTGEGYTELASALFSDIVQQYAAVPGPSEAVEGNVK
jgi:lysophospholipase L1-like esterase